MAKLDLIKQTLGTFGKTYYGKGNPKDSEPWNYYVFRRATLKKAGTSGNDFVRRYTVAIVHEEYIPENHEFEIIKAICEKAKLKLADVDITYDYTFKGSTDFVVEVAVITFSEALKGCDI